MLSRVNLGKGGSRGPRRTLRQACCAGLRAHESPRNQTAANMNLREIAVEFHARSQHSCGLAGFCRFDYLLQGLSQRALQEPWKAPKRCR